MKVMQIRSEFRDNGPGTQSLTIGEELRRRGYEVVFCGGPGVYCREIEQRGFAFRPLSNFSYGQRGPISSLKNVLRLAKYLRDEGVEIVHAHNAASASLAQFAARQARVDIGLVNSVRGVELRRSHAWRNLIYHFTTARLMAVCEYTRQKLIRVGVSPNRVSVTYNGVNLERFNVSAISGEDVRSEFNLRDRLIVGHVGAIDGAKGQQVLVEAIARLRKKYPSLCAVLVGDGPDRGRVELRVAELNVREHVIFAGMRFDSPRFHAAFDVYAQPSTRGEMFPNSILEAMAMRTPWVGSALSGLPEMTAGGEAGRVSDPGDVAALVENLDELLADRKLREQRGRRAEQEVRERFSIQQVVTRIERCYADALKIDADSPRSQRAA